jgi:hypothetical protein
MCILRPYEYFHSKRPIALKNNEKTILISTYERVSGIGSVKKMLPTLLLINNK